MRTTRCRAGSIPPAYASTVVGHDELIPLSAPDTAGQPRHALAARGTTSPVPILAYSAESGIGRVVRALRGAALEGAHAAAGRSRRTWPPCCARMALDGRGVAWLPRSLVVDELASGRLVAAGDAAWAIAVEIRLFRQRSAAPPAAEAFWRAAVEADVPPAA